MNFFSLSRHGGHHYISKALYYIRPTHYLVTQLMHLSVHLQQGLQTFSSEGHIGQYTTFRGPDILRNVVGKMSSRAGFGRRAVVWTSLIYKDLHHIWLGRYTAESKDHNKETQTWLCSLLVSRTTQSYQHLIASASNFIKTPTSFKRRMVLSMFCRSGGDMASDRISLGGPKSKSFTCNKKRQVRGPDQEID